jgi:hypothetical protein
LISEAPAERRLNAALCQIRFQSVHRAHTARRCLRVIHSARQHLFPYDLLFVFQSAKGQRVCVLFPISALIVTDCDKNRHVQHIKTVEQQKNWTRKKNRCSIDFEFFANSLRSTSRTAFIFAFLVCGPTRIIRFLWLVVCWKSCRDLRRPHRVNK